VRSRAAQILSWTSPVVLATGRAGDVKSGFAAATVPLGQAFAEYGRIAKAWHLLRVADPVDDTYRGQTNRQFTVRESRHGLARPTTRRGRWRRPSAPRPRSGRRGIQVGDALLVRILDIDPVRRRITLSHRQAVSEV
jgi:hypothetical protein